MDIDSAALCVFTANMRFIGDVHGKFRRYRELIRDVEKSIQVGDMGVGFIDPRTEEMQANPPFDAMSQGSHYFIRGNHDNPGVCRTQPYWIADGTMHEGVFCVGGGLSIDRDWRIAGYTYWPDEELSMAEFSKIIDVYEKIKPDIVVSHDCPESVSDILCSQHNLRKFNDPSITRRGLQAMFEVHQPKYHFFGHWHVSTHAVIEGTEFRCLAELEVFDL
jgi:hypothetical protein